MKRLLAGVLLFALLLAGCGKDVQEEDGTGEPRTYRLPTEWTVTEGSRTKTFTVAYDGNDFTVTTDGEVAFRITLDEAGNVVHRENADGSELTAVYDADGHLAETLLRNAYGEAMQRTVYDRDGHAVKEYTRGWFDEVTLREFTYGETGELLTEALYHAHQSHTYEYRANGELAAENTYLMDAFLSYRREYSEDGSRTWEYSYDGDGNVSFCHEFDSEGNVLATYDGEGNPYTEYREEDTYDDAGNLTERKTYGKDGLLYWREEYGYDETGSQTERRRYDEEDRLSQECFTTYDGSGRKLKTVEHHYHLDLGILLSTVETEYDEAGNPTQEVYYDPDGKRNSYYVWEYECIGGKWLETLSLSYEGDGTLEGREETTYDENGNETGNWFYDGDGTLVSHTEQVYDERGNRLEYARYDGDGSMTDRFLTVYDEEDNLLEVIYYDGDEITDRLFYENTYEYDEAGRPVSDSRTLQGDRYTYAYKEGSGLRTETCTDGDGNVLHLYETVYDPSGNPRIEQRTDDGYEQRYEYQWGEDGGLLSRVRSDGGKAVLARLETGGHTDRRLTEAQYRQLLALLFTFTDELFVEHAVTDGWME